jgi:hypothetical protein
LDRECIVPPSVLNLAELKKRAKEIDRRDQRKHTATNEIHVNLGFLKDILGKRTCCNGCDRRKRKHKHHHNRSSSDSETPPTDSEDTKSSSSSDESDDESIPIADVLDSLHKKLPQLDYKRYLPALTEKGILFARMALDFDRDYYSKEIQMADGAVGPFLRKAAKLVRLNAKGLKGKEKRRRTGDNNDNDSS